MIECLLFLFSHLSTCNYKQTGRKKERKKEREKERMNERKKDRRKDRNHSVGYLVHK